MGKKAYLALVLTACLMLALTGYAFAAGFSDVQGHWAETQIKQWAEKGLAGGYPDGTFKPDKEVTRAEFVALTNRAFEIEKTGVVEGFSDVKPGQWYYESIAAAKSAGYIGGYSDGTFRPEQTITRQEVASILVRLLGLEQTTEGLAAFTDAGQIPEWSRTSVGAVAKTGLMGGYPDNTFKATRSITRAEAVVTLDRALGYKPVPTGGTIEGTVTLDGKAVAEATVRVFAAGSYEVLKETTTDSNGKYEVELEPGVYDITAATEKEVTYASDVQVTGVKAATVNLALEPAAIISGVLKDKNGKAVKETTILFTTNPTFVAKTDTKGEYTTPVLPNREYKVRAYEPGKEDAEPVVVKESVQVGSVGKHDIGALKAPFSTGSVGGGTSGGGTTPTGPVVLGENDIQAGQTYSDSRGYKIASFGTFGPNSGTATFTSKLIIDPGDNGELVLQNIVAENIEVLSGGKNSVKTKNVKANKVIAKAANGVKIEAGAGTVITETEVEGETHIAVAADVGSDSAKFGAIKIKSGAGGKEIKFSGDLTASTVTVETGDVTMKAESGVLMGEVIIDAPGTVNLAGEGSFGEIKVSEKAGQGGTPVINIAEETTVSKLVLSTTVELAGDVADVPLEVTDPDKVEIIVNDPDTKNDLIDTTKTDAGEAIAGIKSTIDYDDEEAKDAVVSARNKVNAVKVLMDLDSDEDVKANTELDIDKLVNAETIISALKQIAIGYAGDDSAGSVTQNIELVGVVNDLVITWVSDKPGVVDVNGTVTRQQNDVSVTLTATIQKGDITGRKTFTVTVRGVLSKPMITKFAGKIVSAGENVIEVNLDDISTSTGIEVSRDAKLALNIEGLGTIRQFSLVAGRENNIYNILIPSAEEIDVSALDLNKLYQATADCPPATKEEILNAVDFTALFNILSGKPGIKESIINETNLGDLLETVKTDENIVKGDILDAVDFAQVLNAVRYDGNITKEDIFGAVNFSQLVDIVSGIEDETVKNEIFNAVDINALLAATTKEEVFNAVNFEALFEGISKTNESTKDEIVRTINFTDLFEVVEKANSATVEAAFNAINFTALFGAMTGAGDGTIAEIVDVTLQIIGIMQENNISRTDVFNTIQFSELNVESMFTWLSCIDGNMDKLTIEATLTDDAGNENTYTININK